MAERLTAPLHPIFTHFTIALTAASLAFDVFGRLLDAPSLATAAWWNVAVAAPLTVGTLATGVSSRVRLAMEEGPARSWLRAHMALGPAFFGMLVMVALWRASLWIDGIRVPWSYLTMLAALVILMSVQGYLGGELVYRFGAEVRGRYSRLPTEPGQPGQPRQPGQPERSESDVHVGSV